ncbi:MAG: nitroreductase [Spirochaetes bacterium]|nr:MAG: nitroreductase [Spirochaetota bacterium]
MALRTFGPDIITEKCTRCGRCVKVCPRGVLAMAAGGVGTTGEECILCAHCHDVCKFGAIDFQGALRKPVYKSFPYKERVVKPGKIEPGLLVNFARSRRSTRRFMDKPVPQRTLLDLVEFAITAPSGSNTQNWQYTVLPTRERVYGLAQEIGNFFAGLNALVRNPLVRWGAVPFLGMKLVRYYRNNYESVARRLVESNQGKDPLFYGAAALILVHSDGEGSMPHFDAQYASYNMTLLAHALALGSCFIGYASEAINTSGKLRRYLGIPDAHRVHAAVAFGYPDVEFYNLSLRKPHAVHLKD